jgi:hypothetical protein
LEPSIHSSTFPAGTTLSWPSPGCWPRCDHEVPYPLLAISGEQGSAKTVLSKLLKALIDPNAAPVRALSREERELMIAANNGYLLAFDNLSGLPVWLSDALCRLASGGASPSLSSIPTMKRCCFKQPGDPVEADPIATCVRAIMVDRTTWTGRLRPLAVMRGECSRWPLGGHGIGQKPAGAASRLRRAQTFLRTLGIEITFSREGRTGTRIIRVSTSVEETVRVLKPIQAALRSEK